MEGGEENIRAVQAPLALAMVIADAVHRDPGTGKLTILGTFSTIRAPRFPAVHPGLTVYAAATDFHGKTPMKLRLVDADDDAAPLFEGEMDIHAPDPRMVVEMNFDLQNLVFPHPGEYRFQLFAGAEFMLERRIILEPPSGAGHAEPKG